MGVLEVASLVLTTVIGLVVGNLYKRFVDFVGEQREVNRANELAYRSIERDVLYRYFHYVVERGEGITPEEFEHVKRCYEAYHANGGNGAGTLMFERIVEYAKIETGRD